MIDFMRPLDEIWNHMLARYYHIEIGEGSKIEGRLIVQGKGSYKIGKKCHIISKKWLNPVGGDRVVFQTFNNGAISIGNNVGISHAIFCARKSITIENNVLIGGGVKLYDNDFHSLDYNERISGKDEYVKHKPILIREGAFIGAHSIILKGVIVGRHSIVGAGSVVTKDIPDGEIWAGNPARFIRKL